MDKESNRTANGVRQTYEYDARGQLLAVKEKGKDVERYRYDKAGNMLKKTVCGKTTAFTFDDANQLVSSTTDGVTTEYAYDAAGRLVKEGNKTYRYGYLDKVLSVTEGERKYAYDYHVDGQLAKADYGDASEDFLWDGLALIRRGGERFVNEPHVGGGNPVASSKGTTYFNDLLGTTLGTATGKRKERKYSAAALTAFGEDLSLRCPPSPNFSTSASASFFTGKPHVAGLGHAFLFRNYRASLAKWQTADPLGYPDGWNALKYGINTPGCGVDLLGAVWNNGDFVDYYFRQDPSRPDRIDTDQMGLTAAIHPFIREAAIDKIDSVVRNRINKINSDNGRDSFLVDEPFGVACGSIVWALGGGTGYVEGSITCNWWIERFWNAGHFYERKMYYWQFEGTLRYFDSFKDPSDVFNVLPWDIEIPFGRPYDYGHTWGNQFLFKEGYLWARMIE